MKTVEPDKRIAPGHAYSVKSVDDAGNVTVVNPWGPGGGYSDGVYYPGEVKLSPAEYQRYFGSGAIADSY